MKELEIEMLRQIVSRTDLNANKKVDMLVDLILRREQKGGFVEVDLPEKDFTSRFDFDDLSFSGIVSLINKNQEDGKNFILDAFCEIQNQKALNKALKFTLNNQESHLVKLQGSIEHCIKHLGLKKPFAIVNDKGARKEVLFVSDSGIKMEKNVYF